MSAAAARRQHALERLCDALNDLNDLEEGEADLEAIARRGARRVAGHRLRWKSVAHDDAVAALTDLLESGYVGRDAPLVELYSVLHARLMRSGIRSEPLRSALVTLIECLRRRDRNELRLADETLALLEEAAALLAASERGDRGETVGSVSRSASSGSSGRGARTQAPRTEGGGTNASSTGRIPRSRGFRGFA